MAKTPTPKDATARTPKPKTAASKAAKPAAPKKMGPPTLYTDELAEAICDQIELGLSLRSVAALPGMPNRATIQRWLNDPERADFKAMYDFAREARADRYADEIISIADDGSNDTYTDEDGNQKIDYDVIARSRLRVDARKWYAGKLAPRKYGDKVTTEHTGEGGGAIMVNSTVTFVDAPPRSDDE